VGGWQCHGAHEGRLELRRAVLNVKTILTTKQLKMLAVIRRLKVEYLKPNYDNGAG
jgi:hypothetical protein